MEKRATFLVPLFPIAVTNGVPFFLVGGYDISGLPVSAAYCLQACSKLSLATNTLATSGFETAAERLIQSPSFRALYVDMEESQHMKNHVLTQAKRNKGLKN